MFEGVQLLAEPRSPPPALSNCRSLHDTCPEQARSVAVDRVNRHPSALLSGTATWDGTAGVCVVTQRSLPALAAQPPPKKKPHPFSLISLPLPSQGWTRRSDPSPPRCWQELEDLEAGVVWLALSLIRKGSRDALGLGWLACLHGSCPDTMSEVKGPVT